MTAAPPVVVTRAEPGNAATLARARALGLDARAMPLFAARALAWDVPNPAAYDALLLTSAQAVRLAGPDLRRLAALPVHAVGAATAAAAEAAGLTVAATGSGTAQQLIDAMTAGEAPRILWLCGRDRSAFEAGAARIDPLPCYAVDPVDPPPGWGALIAAPAVLLAHSARGAARLAALTEGCRTHLSLVAISAATAAAAGTGWADVTAPPTPDDAAMVTAAHILCQKARK